jgi:hypothetical protein
MNLRRERPPDSAGAVWQGRHWRFSKAAGRRGGQHAGDVIGYAMAAAPDDVGGRGIAELNSMSPSTQRR